MKQSTIDLYTAIRKEYNILDKQNKFKTDYIINEVAKKFFRSPKTIENILFNINVKQLSVTEQKQTKKEVVLDNYFKIFDSEEALKHSDIKAILLSIYNTSVVTYCSVKVIINEIKTRKAVDLDKAKQIFDARK